MKGIREGNLYALQGTTVTEDVAVGTSGSGGDPSSESIFPFAVLVGVRAPPLPDNARHLEREPINLVIVLDVSDSMYGSKLRLLKRAIHFVIDTLGPSDDFQ
ncbi:uncharacterized protein LOC111407382 [Olea europaea subsp. europaea]|uniref:Uncharacterized protein LOC111407382 n=1 Tax=Olea europaea subsp. europaea TaxID=158383 RepID=A0A8S0TVG9_OLEEU|nr:uncharacterized protein LOC111407382 [Olea europaea subsp. europaea]